jgi:hypothetical protein
LGQPVELDETPTPDLSFGARLKKRLRARPELPDDFSAEAYYRLNPDVAVAKADAASHYLRHGRAEGRRYKFRGG